MGKNPAEKGRDEDQAVVQVQQPAVVATTQQYPQPTDAQGNVLTHNGQPYSQEVLARYYAPDNQAPNFKDLSQLASEWDAEQAAAQTQQQPVAAVTTDQQQPAAAYQPLEDWSSGRGFADIVRGSKQPIATLVSDYNKWAKANQKEPLDYWDYAQFFQKYDVDKSVEDNEKDEKRRRNAERWGDIGRVLINLSNFVGALGGAPQPDAQTREQIRKLSDNQRLRREKVKEERRAYNKFLLEQMYKTRNDERQRDKSLAEIGLIQARQKAIQDDQRRKENEERRKENEDKRRETLNQARVDKENANTNLINKKAEHPYTSRVSGSRGGGRPKDTTFETLQNNIEKYPEEAKAFATEYGINGFDHKNQWRTSQAKMFNEHIRKKEASGSSPRTPQTPPTKKTANDYSKYKVKK